MWVLLLAHRVCLLSRFLSPPSLTPLFLLWFRCQLASSQILQPKFSVRISPFTLPLVQCQPHYRFLKGLLDGWLLWPWFCRVLNIYVISIDPFFPSSRYFFCHFFFYYVSFIFACHFSSPTFFAYCGCFVGSASHGVGFCCFEFPTLRARHNSLAQAFRAQGRKCYRAWRILPCSWGAYLKTFFFLSK